MSPADELRAAAKVLLCAHHYPVQVLTDAEMEQLIATGRPLADCLGCGSREDGQDVAAPLRGPLAALLESCAADLEGAESAMASDGTQRDAPNAIRSALTFARTIRGRVR